MPERLAPAIHLSLPALGFCRWLGDSDGLAAFAYFEPGEAAHADVLTQLADFRRDELAHRDGLVLDERLVQQADFLVELSHLAFHDLLHDCGRLAGSSGLRAVDVLLAVEVRG